MANKKRTKKAKIPRVYVHPEGDLVQHRGSVWAPGQIIDLSKLPDAVADKLRQAHSIVTEIQFQRDFTGLWNKAYPGNLSPYPDIEAAMDKVDDKSTVVNEGRLPHQME